MGLQHVLFVVVFVASGGGTAEDGVYECTDDRDADENVEDCKQFACISLRRNVTITNGCQGDGAEIQCVDPAHVFDVMVGDCAEH